ncbi:TerD family protein [Streptomyces sp. 900105755]
MGARVAQGRRTRPWGQLKGTSAEDNAVAKLLRQWLDQAGMRVDDVHGNLTPEHFADGRVPGRSTVADRLAGLGLRQDFVEAMADICSPNAIVRSRLLAQVDDARRRTRAAADGDKGVVGAASADAQLVMVQQRSIEVSDKLLRALERAAQLERERNDANQMVLVLLAMVDKLHRDIATLARERDRLRTSRSVEEELEQVHGRLSRSEQQRATAEAELERARAERHKADQLAEEAAQQVRRLTDELERLRGEVPESADIPEPAAGAPVRHDGLDDGADDIDMALAKAARHLDDSADRLDQLASELHLDNPPDIPPTSSNVVDNSPDNPQMSGSDNVDLTSEQVVADVRALVSEGGAQDRVESLLYRAAQAPSVTQVLQIAVMLRDRNLPDEAAHLLSHAVHRTLPTEMPVLVSSLRRQGQDSELYQLLTQVARHWPASQIVEVMTCLREAEQDSDAYQVLSAVGRDCPPVEVLKVLARLNSQDANWVLEAACRDRPVYELPDLQAALSNLRSADASKVATAYSQRKEAAAAVTPRPRPASLLTGNSHGDLDEEGGAFLRPYALAGGDPRRPRYPLPDNAVVCTTAEPHQLTGQLPEQQRILLRCREPHEVTTLADLLGIPLGVAKILVADLIEAGLLAVQSDVVPTWLGKGGSIELPTEATRNTLVIGLGWQVPHSNGSDFDVDASAIGAKGGRVYSDQYFVFYNNLHAPDNSIVHTGDDAGVDGDQETILVKLAALPSDIDKITFPVSIYEAEKRGQNFGQVRNAYIRITDFGGQEIARYGFSEETATETAMIVGELYHFRGKWKFRAVGQGYASGLLGIAHDFGVTV